MRVSNRRRNRFYLLFGSFFACFMALNLAVKVVRSYPHWVRHRDPAYLAFRERFAQLCSFYRTVRREGDPWLYEFVPGSHATLLGRSYRYNRWGMRDERDFDLTKPPGTRRIAVLGDSIGHGLGVDQDEVVTRQLETLLDTEEKPVEVLNFCVDATSTFDHYHLLKQRVMLFQPDHVVLLVCLNDLFDGRAITPVDEVVVPNRPHPLRLFPVVDWAMDRIERRLTGARTLPENILFRTFEVNLRGLVGILDEAGIDLSIGVTPILQDFPRGKSPHDLVVRRISALGEDLGVRTIPLFEVFADLEVSDYFPGPEESLLYPLDGWHPNARGHARMARLLARHLQMGS